MSDFSRILVPIDFTECSIKVLPYAYSIAEKFSSELFLIYSLAGPEQFKGLGFEEDWFANYGNTMLNEAKKAMENFIKQNMTERPPADTAVRIGDIIEEIVNYAEEKKIDLILMASHDCASAEKRIYGSIAETVSRDAKCPVMIIHPDKIT